MDKKKYLEFKCNFIYDLQKKMIQNLEISEIEYIMLLIMFSNIFANKKLLSNKIQTDAANLFFIL